MTEERIPTVLDEFVERYGHPAGKDGPARLVREVFGAEPDPWQEQVLRAFGGGERRISVASCHGPGKTTVAAWLVWVMLLTRFPMKTVATAPSGGQLTGALVPEIKMWGTQLPKILHELYEFKAMGIYLKEAPESSFFEARTSRAENPEALQGVHSDNVLLIADEASGVAEQVYEAAVGSMSGHNATTLLISNPVRTSGLFYDTHHSLKDMWFTIQVGHADSPRVTADFVEDVARRYGEESSAFRVRALGKFPKTDEDTVIPFEAVESARGREVTEMPDARYVWGLDVARFGSDRCALVRRSNRRADVLDIWSDTDTMETAGRIKSRWDELPASMQPSTILIDVIGMGAGVVDRLRELGLPARGVNVSEAAAINTRFSRARSELWWKAREWLMRQDVCLPVADPDLNPRHDPAETLASELVVPRYGFTSDGKLLVEPKADTKKRMRKSPDVADAFVLTFAEDLSILTGASAGGSWDQPIKRGLAIV